MKNIYLAITFAAILFATNITRVYAQNDTFLVPESNYNGHGVTLADLSFENKNGKGLSERIMFYNVGKKKFLNAGGKWGTRAATHTAGLSLQLENQSGTGSNTRNRYYIKTPYYGQGTYMGYAGSGVYFDRGNSDSGTNLTFTITKVSNSSINQNIRDTYGITDSDNIYRIQVNGLVLVANRKMETAIFKDTNQNLVEAETNPSDVQYTYWKIVNLEEIKKTVLDETNIYNSEPADLTFLIRAQNFNHRNKYNRNVDAEQPEAGDNRGWHFDFTTVNGVNPYTTKFDQDAFKIDGYPYSDDTHGDGKYGMFDCAEIRNRDGNATVKENERLWQTVPVTTPGWYRIDCQGFFYNNGDPEDCCAKLFAYSDENAAEGTATNAYVNLLPQRYFVNKNEHPIANDMDGTYNRNAKLSNLIAGDKPETHVEAGVALYTNEYPNSVMIYVPTASTDNPVSITFGIAATRDFEDNDVVWADNFNLKYLGQSFALDDQGKLNSDRDFQNRPLILRRALTKDKWSSIVLPVNLTKQQVNTTFFPTPASQSSQDSKPGLRLNSKSSTLTNSRKTTT